MFQNVADPQRTPQFVFCKRWESLTSINLLLFFVSISFISLTGVFVKKSILGALLLSTALTSGAYAGQTDDIMARLDAIEKENAAIRKENAALRENKRLHEQHSQLTSSKGQAKTPIEVQAAPQQAGIQPAPPVVAAVAPAAAAEPSNFQPLRSIRASVGSVFEDDKKDPFASYAADLPTAYKAPMAQHGELRLWGEGGAIWTNGDPVTQNFAITDFSNALGFLGGGLFGATRGGQFNLTPKVGWEAAAGFDYHFANSPWHASMQFRYGEGGKTSGTVTSSGSVDLAALIALLGGNNNNINSGTFGGSDTFSSTYKEAHWLADFAVGRDVFGSGRDAMQVKGGIRLAGYTDNLNSVDNNNIFATFNPGIPFLGNNGPVITSFGTNTQTLTQTRDSFLGAGPKVGIEGSIPFAGNWTLDYLGDAAILFGTERTSTTTTVNTVVTPAVLGALIGNGNSVNTNTAQRYTSMFSGDLQVGVGYWITPQMKLAASYRADAMIHVQNTDLAGVTTFTPDRVWHGPRLTLTGKFDAN